MLPHGREKGPRGLVSRHDRLRNTTLQREVAAMRRDEFDPLEEGSARADVPQRDRAVDHVVSDLVWIASGKTLASCWPYKQEIRALLCAYHAIREMICAAAALARTDPVRILLHQRPGHHPRPGRRPGRLSPERLARAAMGIIAAVTNPDRRGRTNPRHATRSTSYPARPADPARRPGPAAR